MTGLAHILSSWGLGPLLSRTGRSFTPGLGVISGPIETPQAQALIQFIRGIERVGIPARTLEDIVSMTKSASPEAPGKYIMGRQVRNAVLAADFTDQTPKRSRWSRTPAGNVVIGSWHIHPQNKDVMPSRDSDPYHLIGRGKVGAQIIIVSRVEGGHQKNESPPHEKVIQGVRVAVWKVANFGRRLEIMWDKDEFSWGKSTVRKGQAWDTDVWLEPAAWEELK